MTSPWRTHKSCPADVPAAARELLASALERLGYGAENARENRQDLAALRIVVKRGFSYDMADQLLYDLKRQLSRLEKQPAPVLDQATGSGFHH